MKIFKGKLAKLGMILGLLIGLELGTSDHHYEMVAIANKANHVNRNGMEATIPAYRQAIQSIQERPIPIMMMHEHRNHTAVIGWITAGAIVGDELRIKADIFNKEQGARLHRGELRYLSIGFFGDKVADGQGNKVTYMDLFEVSVVTVPADKYAIILSVKKIYDAGIVLNLLLGS